MSDRRQTKGDECQQEGITLPVIRCGPNPDEESKQSAMEHREEWLIKNCPLMYRQSELSRLSPIFLEACNAWEMGFEGLGLFGPTGSTKTRCMWELLRRVSLPWPKQVKTHRWFGDPPTVETRIEYYSHNINVLRDVDFARECALQFKDGHDMKKLFSWKKCDLLFIDDLGKCRITERVQTELFDLIDFRTSNGMPILWTSNFNAQGLAKRFASPDDAGPILRRLVESCQIVEAA